MKNRMANRIEDGLDELDDGIEDWVENDPKDRNQRRRSLDA